tara:strand:- start:12281 stop:12664 length:384 start_codon:yes stop_codon:yes gene_type:complete
MRVFLFLLIAFYALSIRAEIDYSCQANQVDAEETVFYLLYIGSMGKPSRISDDRDFTSRMQKRIQPYLDDEQYFLEWAEYAQKTEQAYENEEYKQRFREIRNQAKSGDEMLAGYVQVFLDPYYELCL